MNAEVRRRFFGLALSVGVVAGCGDQTEVVAQSQAMGDDYTRLFQERTDQGLGVLDRCEEWSLSFSRIEIAHPEADPKMIELVQETKRYFQLLCDYRGAFGKDWKGTAIELFAIVRQPVRYLVQDREVQAKLNRQREKVLMLLNQINPYMCQTYGVDYGKPASG